MMLATVIGKADSSVKSAGLQGRKLLIVRGLDASGRPEGGLVMALDAVGAGSGDVVAVAFGGSALAAAGLSGAASDAAVVAILDHVFVEDRELLPHNRRTGI